MAECRSPTKYQGPPITLRNMRENGVRAVIASCEKCGHKADVVADQLPDDVFVPGVAKRLRCSQCGSKRINSRPAWHTVLRPGMGV
jgi:DNA-directed RNA polymerase subunit RPC12/RpoP